MAVGEWLRHTPTPLNFVPLPIDNKMDDNVQLHYSSEALHFGTVVMHENEQRTNGHARTNARTHICTCTHMHTKT